MTTVGQIGIGFDPSGLLVIALMLILFIVSIGLGVAGFAMSLIPRTSLKTAFALSAASGAAAVLCASAPSIFALRWLPLPPFILGPVALAGFPGYLGALVAMVRLQRRSEDKRS
ncbi:MAG: hypothetical protein AAGK09_06240 [Planctomycetota bacterium]